MLRTIGSTGRSKLAKMAPEDLHLGEHLGDQSLATTESPPKLRRVREAGTSYLPLVY